MHDLQTRTALGGTTPRVDTFDHVTISENDGLSLASVAARLGQEEACKAHIRDLIGAVPGPDQVQLHDPEAGFWIGQDQWMIGAPKTVHPALAEVLKDRFKGTASITDQTGAWATFDVQGPAMADMCERLCNIPIRQMQAGDARRTVIHQIGCFVTRRQADDHIRVLGPRSSAKSLHHALLTAAHAVA